MASYGTMRNYLLLFGGSLLLGIGIFVLFSRVSQTPVLSGLARLDESAFSLEKPPKDSLVGIITHATNQVYWESRIATIPAQVTLSQPLHQGESISTLQKGEVILSFQDILHIQLFAQSALSLLQTLPEHIVIGHTKGKGTYTLHAAYPVTIRASSVIIQAQDATVSVQSTPETLQVTLKKGSAQVGFNDSEKTSHVVFVSENNVFTFDETTKTHTLVSL